MKKPPYRSPLCRPPHYHKEDGADLGYWAVFLINSFLIILGLIFFWTFFEAAKEIVAVTKENPDVVKAKVILEKQR